MLDQYLTVNCSFLRIVQLISHHTLITVCGISEVIMASKRRLKSGNYQVQIRLLGPLPIVRSFSTKKKSQEFARPVEGDSELARKLDALVIQSLSFKELVDKYMAQYVGENPSTPGKLNNWITQFGDKQMMHIASKLSLNV